GQVVGTVHAYMNEASQKYQQLGYRVAEKVLNPVVATNFACLPSEVVEKSAQMTGCSNVNRVIEHKRRSSQQIIAGEYESALEASRLEAQSLFDLSAAEVSDVLKVAASTQHSDVFVPLKRRSES